MRGRREGRVPTGTRGPRAKKMHGAGTTGSAGNNPAFPAQWFERLLRALPGDRACCPRHRHRRRPRHQRRGVGTTRLDRPHDDVRPHLQGDAASPRGHRSPPQRPVTIAMRPSQCGRDSRIKPLIWGRRQQHFWYSELSPCTAPVLRTPSMVPWPRSNTILRRIGSRASPKFPLCDGTSLVAEDPELLAVGATRTTWPSRGNATNWQTDAEAMSLWRLATAQRGRRSDEQLRVRQTLGAGFVCDVPRRRSQDGVSPGPPKC